MRATVIVLFALLILMGIGAVEAAVPQIADPQPSVAAPAPCEGVTLLGAFQIGDKVTFLLSGPQEKLARCASSLSAILNGQAETDKANP